LANFLPQLLQLISKYYNELLGIISTGIGNTWQMLRKWGGTKELLEDWACLQSTWDCLAPSLLHFG